MGELFNCRHRNVPSGAVNIMRPGRWGNPFPVSRKLCREDAIRLYEHWLSTQPKLVAGMRRDLNHKDLVCCCWPLACHGDVILRVVAGEAPRPLPPDHPLLGQLTEQGDHQCSP